MTSVKKVIKKGTIKKPSHRRTWHQAREEEWRSAMDVINKCDEEIEEIVKDLNKNHPHMDWGYDSNIKKFVIFRPGSVQYLCLPWVESQLKRYTTLYHKKDKAIDKWQNAKRALEMEREYNT